MKNRQLRYNRSPARGIGHHPGTVYGPGELLEYKIPLERGGFFYTTLPVSFAKTSGTIIAFELIRYLRHRRDEILELLKNGTLPDWAWSFDK